nr:MAG TPA: hypothetical protein [Caudoviricetes sp.]
MKASERKRNKFKAIKKRKKTIKLDKNIIRLSYPKRHENDTLARYVFLETVEKLHRDLFALRAMEKQIKMPVKVVVVGTKIYKHKITLGFFMPAVFRIDKESQCPVCGEVVREELSYCIDQGKKLNYCPRCGQKLWWKR